MNPWQKAMYRLAIVFAIAIAIFWTIWWLAKGQLPTPVSIIPISENLKIHLPFTISHWWDILTGPIWLVFIIFYYSDVDFFTDLKGVWAWTKALTKKFGAFSFSIGFVSSMPELGFSIALIWCLILQLTLGILSFIVVGMIFFITQLHERG